MNWIDFAIRMFSALFFGAAIGLERQWRQRMTGLRTNGLVAAGAAMFVMIGGLIAGEGSQGRVAAYVVSGIGFLGGGVILKHGTHIRGLNTAATLWCTASVGMVAGLGRVDLAAIGTVGVLAANLLLRPVGHHMRRRPSECEERESVPLVPAAQ
jgi:putative Mg2+ transporter-C (MgtC) family protein